MRFISFRIRNFKGIKDTIVPLKSVAGASVFAFVGLNESGKTTVLEAIHSFAPDEATSELLGGEEGLGVPFGERVPRHLLSEFTGDVSVTAVVELDLADKKRIAATLKANSDLDLRIETIPDQLRLERQQEFKNGDFSATYFTLRTKCQIKRPKQRNWRDPENKDERLAVRDAVYEHVPRIAYFPTFVFDFPKTVFLTERGGLVDKFYRRTFQDILDFDGRGQTIGKDIVRRVRQPSLIKSWPLFWSIWNDNDDRDKIQQVMDRASAAVTNLVFGRWNRIFGEDTKGKEVSISYDIVEGEIIDEAGNKSKTDEHDVRVKFQIKDGTRRYDVNDRSLGFRWFFSFMLFTQFRVARAGVSSPPLLFLFDEPASNLHAAAQQKLIESFPEIAQNGHLLAYSTHSHYMIEPKWLEQTFIVTNRSDAPLSSLLDEISLDDESLDVQVATYRSFVNSHPGQTSYFQPVLDRLAVIPSKFDMHKDSIVLEGKSDYYVLRYAEKLLRATDLALLPGLGAGTFGALAALHAGWNLNFLFLLDGDPKGEAERERYCEEFGIKSDRLVTLRDFDPDLKKIEDLLDSEAKDVIRDSLDLTRSPTKNQIRRFFQERLASDSVVPLGNKFATKSGDLLDKLRSYVSSQKSDQ
ncbi:AAA family ATPase [Hoeflea sp. TYP-13]|uniref:AAA family ATPase n=1 Tax=Hoeflea sp. TYP-13 TaxID=3230023 RepID=UPI0034C5E869